jgi:hypothetical protein
VRVASHEDIARQMMAGSASNSPQAQPQGTEGVDPKDPFGLKLPPMMPSPAPQIPTRSTPGYQQSPEFQNWLQKRNNGDWHQRIIAPPG